MSNKPSLTSMIIVLLSLAWASSAVAGDEYTVTITNLTAGQIFSPPLLATHSSDADIFEPGEAASAELAALAEDGDTSGLAALLGSDSAVNQVVLAAGPILPGDSMSLTIEARGRDLLSVVGMLVTTNDAFFGVDSLPLKMAARGGTPRASAVRVVAYDAGSEANNEDCGYIPGPPCGNPGVRDTADAEGFVHVHRGIHGVADLAPSAADWRNPVAEIRWQRN